MKEIVLLEGARTPFAEISGSFKELNATELGAIAAKEEYEKLLYLLKILIKLYLVMFSSLVKMHIYWQGMLD